MYLLQAGTTANVAVDFTQMSELSHAIIVIGGLLALAMILFVLTKYRGKIYGLDFNKDTIESSVYEMNREIFNVDDQLRMKVRTITSSLKTRLRNIFYEAKMCPVAVIALTNSAIGPLNDSAANNHFTTVMLPENRDDYLNKLLRAIEDEYRSTYNAMLNFECGDKGGLMPSWERISDPGIETSPRDRVQEFLKEWVNDVTTETIKACIKKIEVYKSYETAFKGNKYRSDILASCIGKNERYKNLLDRHGKGWQ